MSSPVTNLLIIKSILKNNKFLTRNNLLQNLNINLPNSYKFLTRNILLHKIILINKFPTRNNLLHNLNVNLP